MPSRSIHVVANSKISFFLKFKKKKWLSSCSLWTWLPHGMWDPSSLTKGQTYVPCIARQIFDLWTTREIPILFYAEQYSVMCLCVYKYIHTEVSLSIYPLMDTESCFHILAIVNNAAGKCACIFSS